MEQYIDKIESYIVAHPQISNEPEFNVLMYDTVKEMKDHQVGTEAILPILALMEKHPLVDYGIPGPLVHFLEGFNEMVFINELVMSIKRSPSIHTVWMLVRELRSLDENEAKAKELIEVLRSVAENESLHDAIRYRAIDYMENEM